MTLHTVCTSHQYQPDSTASESSLRIYALFGFAEHDAGRSLWKRMDTNAATVTVKPCVCPKRQAPYTCQVQRAGRAAWKVCGRLERSSRGGEKTAIPLLAMPWAGTLKFTGNYHEKSGTYTAPHNLQNIANCGACVCDVMIYNTNQSFSIYYIYMEKAMQKEKGEKKKPSSVRFTPLVLPSSHLLHTSFHTD